MNESKKSTVSFSKYLIGLPFVLGMLIALFSPVDVLGSNYFRFVYEAGAYIFPSVEKLKGNYELGQVAKLYFSSMWLLSPVIFFGGYLDLQRQQENIIEKCRQRKVLSTFFFAVFIPGAALALFLINFESNDLNDVRTVLTFHSRLGMPFWGFVIPAGSSVMFAMTAIWVSNLANIFDSK